MQPVARGFGYIFYYKSNIRCMDKESENLKNIRTMGAQKTLEVGMLSEEKAWILFRQKVGNFVDDPSLLDIAKKVAKECKGLPLAIISVARALKKS
uniref:Nucleotide binding site-leucine rich repeat protein n=1 Tax=Solanum tuberosum TaxID=4113 RepID=M1BZW6_SOLTU